MVRRGRKGECMEEVKSFVWEKNGVSTETSVRCEFFGTMTVGEQSQKSYLVPKITRGAASELFQNAFFDVLNKSEVSFCSAAVDKAKKWDFKTVYYPIVSMRVAIKEVSFDAPVMEASKLGGQQQAGLDDLLGAPQLGTTGQTERKTMPASGSMDGYCCDRRILGDLSLDGAAQAFGAIEGADDSLMQDIVHDCISSLSDSLIRDVLPGILPSNASSPAVSISCEIRWVLWYPVYELECRSKISHVDAMTGQTDVSYEPDRRLERQRERTAQKPPATPTTYDRRPSSLYQSVHADDTSEGRKNNIKTAIVLIAVAAFMLYVLVSAIVMEVQTFIARSPGVYESDTDVTLGLVAIIGGNIFLVVVWGIFFFLRADDLQSNFGFKSVAKTVIYAIILVLAFMLFASFLVEDNMVRMFRGVFVPYLT